MLVGGFATLLLAIFARLMRYDFKRDEQLYAAPVALLSDFNLYADVWYNHLPGSAWLFYWMSPLAGDQVLLAARLGVFFGWIIFAAAVFWVSYKLTRSLLMTVLSSLLVLTNDAFLTVAGMTATNNFLPLPFAYLALGLFVLGIREKEPDRVYIGLSGVCLSIAATIKVSAVGFIAPVVMAAFFLPMHLGFKKRITQVVVPLAIGGIVAALPVLIMFASDPDLFIAHVLGFHTGPHPAYWADRAASGAETAALAFSERALLGYLVLTGGANIVLALVVLSIGLMIFTSTGSWRGLLNGPVFVVAAVFIVTLILSLAPKPSFPQYFAPPVVALTILAPLLFSVASEKTRQQLTPLMLSACVVLIVINLPRLTQDLAKVASPNSWTTTKVHQAGQKIADQIDQAGLQGKVATLMPIYALEGGLDVYPEFATGQFVFRVAGYLSPELEAQYVVVQPDKVEAMFDQDPPAAVFVGFEPDFETPLRIYAEKNNYRRVDDLGISDRYGDGVLYLRRE